MSQLQFDDEGKLILPEMVRKDIEEQKRREEEAEKFNKKLIIRYIGSEIEEFIRCEFEIDLPKDVNEIRKKILEIKDWVDKKEHLKEWARCQLEKNGDDYRLMIRGNGYDGRCEWCRSFRTALNKSLFDLKVAVYQKGFCKFDKGNYRKVKSEGKIK